MQHCDRWRVHTTLRQEKSACNTVTGDVCTQHRDKWRMYTTLRQVTSVHNTVTGDQRTQHSHKWQVRTTLWQVVGAHSAVTGDECTQHSHKRRVHRRQQSSTSVYIGYGDPSNTTIFKYTLSDVYLFGQHVSTLLLGHLQAVEVYTKVLWFTPTCRQVGVNHNTFVYTYTVWRW
jgi:hypothetical protein